MKPAKVLRGSITVPGDKSISHRGLLLGAIADGNTRLYNLSTSVDVISTLNCLRQLNIGINKNSNYVEISGKGLYGIKASSTSLNCGNSGTTMRLLSGILAAQPFTTTLIGDVSLSKRPMSRIIEPLTQMGAKIHSQPGGLAPLNIHGNQLNPIHYRSSVASAQIKSCILLAGLYAQGMTTVIEPHLSRDHTERMLTDFGVFIKKNGLVVSIEGQQALHGCKISVPGDFSSAAFFICAALMVPDSELNIKNICLNPTRMGLLEILNQMRAEIEIQKYEEKSSEPIGEITVFTSQLNGVEIPPELVSKLIDEVPIIAIIATHATGTTRLSGAKELRIKESDRLYAIVRNLSLMGIQIEEKEDGFIIEGPQKLKGATLKSYGDHRIAMAFAIAGLIADGETQLINPECVEISMPNFFETLQGIIIE
ncbi:MAG: 3-phosphoshikimate 1-carboxyvinyltransferase [bacterium]|nr:MAG: 3-phosphoshikimate 1-carboxyvinyltransferase [bacterium]